MLALLLFAAVTSPAYADARSLPNTLLQDYRLDPISIQRELHALHSDLEVHFVLAGADPRFAWLPYNAYSQRYELEKYSEKESFGRMLCPSHPRNPTQKFIIIVRSDEPGDTLAHEYVHYLQAKTTPELCSFFARLETHASQEDLKKNALLEYEANRVTYQYAEQLKLSELARIGILDRVGRFAQQSGSTESLDKRNQWESLSPGAWTELLVKTASGFQKKIESQKKTAAPISNNALPQNPSKLPLCLDLKSLPEAWRTAADESIQSWNRLFDEMQDGPAFQWDDCSAKPIQLTLNSESPSSFADGRITLASRALPDRLNINSFEFKEFEGQLAAKLRKHERDSPSQNRTQTGKENKETYDRALHLARRHIIAHLLGHALGLDHHFHESEESVMSFNTEIYQPSARDRAAIRLIRNKKFPKKSKSETKSHPESPTLMRTD